MSLYNLLFGKNQNTEVILAILGFKENDVERFRDCGFEENGIFIYTRTGGGNREDYPNGVITQSPYYLFDEDDDFDNTYATYHFKIPSEIEKDVKEFQDIRKNGISGKLIRWILKTIERKETKEDIYSKQVEMQSNYVSMGKKNIYETNGWVVVPLDDDETGTLLKMMEDAGGEQLSYNVMPYKVVISQNVPKWNFEKNKTPLEITMCRLKVEMPDTWEIDQDLWKRWKEKFGKVYPKAIKTIEKSI